jgi:predicted transcriptional regulator
MNTTSIKLPDALKSEVADLAQQRQISTHAFMVQAIEDAVSRSKLRAAWVAEGERRLDDYQAGRRGIDAEDVFAWMRERGAGVKRAVPKARKA